MRKTIMLIRRACFEWEISSTRRIEIGQTKRSGLVKRINPRTIPVRTIRLDTNKYQENIIKNIARDVSIPPISNKMSFEDIAKITRTEIC